MLEPDPCPPVQPLEPHHHSSQRLPLAIIDVIKSDTVTIFGHLLSAEEWIRFLKQAIFFRANKKSPAEPNKQFYFGWVSCPI